MKKLAVFLFSMAPLVYMGIIWLLSSYPADTFVKTPFSFDHILKESLHLIEFGILYWLFVFALAVHQKLTAKTSLAAAVTAFLYGLCDEIHQYFVPSRSMTLIDLVKDAIGVSASYYIVKIYYFTRNQSKLKTFLDLLINIKKSRPS